MPATFFGIRTGKAGSASQQAYVLASPETYTEENAGLPSSKPARVAAASVDRLETLPGIKGLSIVGKYPIADVTYVVGGQRGSGRGGREGGEGGRGGRTVGRWGGGAEGWGVFARRRLLPRTVSHRFSRRFSHRFSHPFLIVSLIVSLGTTYLAFLWR
jgi:hypothetical protein